VKPWFFPQLVGIIRDWLRQCVDLKGGTFLQLLLLHEHAHDAVDRIYQAIVNAEPGPKTLKPILRPYDTVASTVGTEFDTTKPCWPTRADKSHLTYAVCDTGTWEQKTAQVLEDMDEVVAYVKNERLGWTIPYTLNGQEHLYTPDFVARIRDAGAEPLNLIVEVSGEALKEKAAKVATATTLWVPAVNNYGQYGRWAYVEIDDPWDAAVVIRAAVRAASLPLLKETLA